MENNLNKFVGGIDIGNESDQTVIHIFAPKDDAISLLTTIAINNTLKANVIVGRSKPPVLLEDISNLVTQSLEDDLRCIQFDAKEFLRFWKIEKIFFWKKSYKRYSNRIPSNMNRCFQSY